MIHWQPIVTSLIYSGIGIFIFALDYKVAEWLLPFNLAKELSEDDNTAVGVLMGSIMLGLAIIIAAAIHG